MARPALFPSSAKQPRIARTPAAKARRRAKDAAQGASASWPFSQGPMAQAIRAHDWGATPLGPTEGWPAVLRFSVTGMLQSRHPGLVAWGPDLVAIGNDAFAGVFDRDGAGLGRPLREADPDLWHVLEPLQARALAGEASFTADLPLTIPRPGEPDLSWWTISCAPIHDETGCVGGVQTTVLESSTRVRLQRRQVLLLAIGDALRRRDDPVAMAAEVCALLGRHLGADRVAYAEIDRQAGAAVVGRGWTADEQPDRPGRYALADFGAAFVDRLRAGEAVAVDAVGSDARTAGGTIYASFGIGAFLAVPLIREGRWVNALSVAMAAPHAWTREEIGLVTAVAERTWEAVERARAETSLRRSRDRLDAALDAACMVAWDWYPDSDRTTMSGAVAKVFGLPPGQTITSGAQGLGYVHPEDAARTRALVQGSGARGVGYENEFRIVRPVDGAVAWLAERACPRVDPVTGERGLTGLVWDVSRRKAAEHASEAARQEVADELTVVRQLHDWAVRVAQPAQWQALLDEMLRAALAVLRADFGTIRLYEPAEDRLTLIAHHGCDPRYLDCFRSVGLDGGDPVWNEALSGGRRVAIADLCDDPGHPGMRRAASEFGFQSLQVTPLFDRTGVAVGALSTGFQKAHAPSEREWRLVDLYGAQIADVIGARQARDALATSEQRLRRLIEGVPQLIWRSRSNGYATWHSPQWFAYTGLNHEQCLGRGWLEAMHPDDRPGVLDAWARAEIGGAYEAECRIWSAREQRYRWFQERAIAEPVGGDGWVEWIGTSTDVDALRTLQERQRVLLSELQHRVRGTMLRLRAVVRHSMQADAGLGAAEGAMHLESRLDALVRAQGPVMRAPHAGVDLYELVANELTAHHARDGERAAVSGPTVRLRAGAADILALALHELALNAVEHGVLSRPRGRVRVRWIIESEGECPSLHLVWSETGGSGLPAGPVREGFGFAFLKRMLPEALEARTAIALDPTGLTCTLVVPLTARIVPA